MPRKIDTIKIAGTKYDARVKLSEDQREAIKILTREGYSQRRLAAMFNVSRRLVQSILNPPERSPQPKHSLEYWNEIKRRSRERKMALYLAGKLQISKGKNEKKTHKI